MPGSRSLGAAIVLVAVDIPFDITLLSPIAPANHQSVSNHLLIDFNNCKLVECGQECSYFLQNPNVLWNNCG
jgi:hypothetical protein